MVTAKSTARKTREKKNGDTNTKEIQTVKGIIKKLWRHIDLIVVVDIVALAVLLGILNNLRVADERKVKWFGGPEPRTGMQAAEDVTP